MSAIRLKAGGLPRRKAGGRDEGILTDSSDASKPVGSPDARSGQNRKFNSQFDSLHSPVRQSKTSEKLTFIDKKKWPMTDGMRHLLCGHAVI